MVAVTGDQFRESRIVPPQLDFTIGNGIHQNGGSDTIPRHFHGGLQRETLTSTAAVKAQQFGIEFFVHGVFDLVGAANRGKVHVEMEEESPKFESSDMPGSPGPRQE
ncbi:hypothetical protein [Pendulispora albinea]|uniref:Uncharacterized protein n=1 Tax=Pendulispora albinea TaxID=2741071 RepID=A0ABZ2LVT3_9BACT